MCRMWARRVRGQQPRPGASTWAAWSKMNRLLARAECKYRHSGPGFTRAEWAQNAELDWPGGQPGGRSPWAWFAISLWTRGRPGNWAWARFTPSMRRRDVLAMAARRKRAAWPSCSRRGNSPDVLANTAQRKASELPLPWEHRRRPCLLQTQRDRCTATMLVSSARMTPLRPSPHAWSSVDVGPLPVGEGDRATDRRMMTDRDIVIRGARRERSTAATQCARSDDPGCRIALPTRKSPARSPRSVANSNSVAFQCWTGTSAWWASCPSATSPPTAGHAGSLKQATEALCGFPVPPSVSAGFPSSRRTTTLYRAGVAGSGACHALLSSVPDGSSRAMPGRFRHSPSLSSQAGDDSAGRVRGRAIPRRRPGRADGRHCRPAAFHGDRGGVGGVAGAWTVHRRHRRRAGLGARRQPLPDWRTLRAPLSFLIAAAVAWFGVRGLAVSLPMPASCPA